MKTELKNIFRAFLGFVGLILVITSFTFFVIFSLHVVDSEITEEECYSSSNLTYSYYNTTTGEVTIKESTHKVRSKIPC